MPDDTSKRSRDETVTDHVPRGAKKRSRGYTGCLTCRRRKIKCDEHRPACHGCTRNKLPCEWDPLPLTARPTGTIRRACDPCRAAKSACAFKETSSICDTCERKRIACYSSLTAVAPASHASAGPTIDGNETTLSPRSTSASETVDAPNPEPASLTPDELARVAPKGQAEEPIGGNEDVQRLIAVYFFRVYNVSWHGFLHKATFLQRLRNGDIPRHLLDSVCLAASVALGLEQKGCQTRLRGLLQQIGEAMSAPTLDLLATVLNAIYCELALGRMASVWMLSGMANRIALVHQLALPCPPSLSPTTVEVRHRLFWACYCIDTALTLPAPQLAQFSSIAALEGIPLPVNERRFLLRQRGHPRTLSLPWVPPSGESVFEEGMPAQNVIVFALVQQVVRYRAFVSSDRPWMAGSRFAECYRDLLAWRTGLDDALQFTEENVYTRIEMGQLTALFALHVRYTWALGTLLDTARQRYNPRYAVEAGVWASDIARLSREAWCGISNAVKEILKVVPDFVPGDPMLGDMIITAIEMQLSNREMHDPTLLESDILALLDLLEKMAKRFHGIRTQLDYLLRRQSMHLRAVLESSKMDVLLREYAVPDAVPNESSAMASSTNYHTSSSVWMPGFTLDEPVNVGDNPSTSVWDFSLSADPTPRADLDPPNALGPLALPEQNTSTFGYGDYELPMPQYQLDNDDTSSSRAPYQVDRASAGRWDVAGAAGSVGAAYQLFM